MGFRNSPVYIQRDINRYLHAYRGFARYYINDIVIFFCIIKEHKEHLRKIFNFLRERNISLGPIKTWIGYNNVELLGFRVNGFGFLNTKERLAVIINL